MNIKTCHGTEGVSRHFSHSFDKLLLIFYGDCNSSGLLFFFLI
ncbi:hypothetical protein E2C01_045258 [Portunus trituberculatus]|uniref:Uncharacterized protein n=1 Tax=Portunus trituberculatus TaxID=210409 RepID=A0A5B7G4J7_PORTR|nr:hypothetical protein [Portunus trituberculatus]